jgi:Protein of unknown function (DUF4232)
MDDDQSRLERELRERAAEVPYLQEAPAKVLARARRRVARNALTSLVVVGLIVVGASAGLGALRGPTRVITGNHGSPSPTQVPSTSVCTASDLRATGALSGAMGSVGGAIDLKNTGATTCTLTGRPTVTLTSSTGDALSVQVTDVIPQWQADGKPSPQGWPIVSLRPGTSASIRVSWSNECPQLSNPVAWSVELGDGGGLLNVAGADAAFAPPCNGSAEPSILQVGPFEPGTGA